MKTNTFSTNNKIVSISNYQYIYILLLLIVCHKSQSQDRKVYAGGGLGFTVAKSYFDDKFKNEKFKADFQYQSNALVFLQLGTHKVKNKRSVLVHHLDYQYSNLGLFLGEKLKDKDSFVAQYKIKYNMHYFNLGSNLRLNINKKIDVSAGLLLQFLIADQSYFKYIEQEEKRDLYTNNLNLNLGWEGDIGYKWKDYRFSIQYNSYLFPFNSSSRGGDIVLNQFSLHCVKNIYKSLNKQTK